jgi:hypothetical protein
VRGGPEEHCTGDARNLVYFHVPSLRAQEFMITPIGAPTFTEALRWGPRSTTR